MKFTQKQIFDIYSLTTIELAERQISSLDYLYSNYDVFVSQNLNQEVQKKVDKINKIGVANFTEEQLIDFTNEMNHYYGLSIQAKVTLSNYMLVASFSFYEIAFKKLLGLTNKLTDKQLESCYKKSEAKKLLKSKFLIEYDNLIDYDKIEELRCLNNAIKHNGIVGRELNQSKSKWILNSRIGDTHADFLRLKDAPIILLTDLKKKLEPKI